MSAPLTLGDNVGLIFDTNSQHGMQWNSATAHIEVNGPVWVTSVVYNNDVVGDLPPIGSGPNDWNFCSRVIYSAGLPGKDAGQHVAIYGQMTKCGPEPAELWAGCFEARDTTGAPSSVAGVMQPMEIDLFANGSDDLSTQIGRTLLSFVLGQNNTAGSPVEATCGISFNVPGGHRASFKTPIAVSAPFSQAGLDFRNSSPGPNARLLWGKDNLPVALDTAGVATVRWDGTARRFKFAYQGRDVFSVDPSGNLRCAGTLQTGCAV
jgi:hypothetical protein